jgi:hypothetical protein
MRTVGAAGPLFLSKTKFDPGPTSLPDSEWFRDPSELSKQLFWNAFLTISCPAFIVITAPSPTTMPAPLSFDYVPPRLPSCCLARVESHANSVLYWLSDCPHPSATPSYSGNISQVGLWTGSSSANIVKVLAPSQNEVVMGRKSTVLL